jgi:hypothetical protein
VEQTWPSAAARKRTAAAKLEQLAIRKRAEAAELQRKWEEYVAQRDAAKSKPRRRKVPA